MGTASGLINIVIKVIEATTGQAIGRIVNLLIPFAILQLHPPSERTDQFFLAFSVAFFFYGTVGNAITDATVPKAAQGQPLLASRERLLLSSGVAFIAGCIMSGWVISSDSHFSPILLGGAMLSVGSGIYAAYQTGCLHAEERYMWPGLSWGVRIIPLAIYWLAHPQMVLLPWLMAGLGISDFIRASLLVKADKSDRPLTRSLVEQTNLIPIIMAASISGLNPIIDRIIAGIGASGSISLLEFGERLYGIVATLSTIGILNIVLVKLSKRRAATQFHMLWRKMLLLTLAWAVAWFLLSLLSWRLFGEWVLFHVFSFSEDQASTIDLIFLCYLIGLPPFMVGLTCVRAYIATGWLYKLLPVSALSLIANLVLSLLLYHYLDLAGIALATSFVYTVTAILMVVRLSRFQEAPARTP
ncbi:MAG: lipid II flippase MurJ [Pyrinomonadaceae bacterium]